MCVEIVVTDAVAATAAADLSPEDPSNCSHVCIGVFCCVHDVAASASPLLAHTTAHTHTHTHTCAIFVFLIFSGCIFPLFSLHVMGEKEVRRGRRRAMYEGRGEERGRENMGENGP